MTRQGGQIPHGGEVEGRMLFRGRGFLHTRRGVVSLPRCRVLSRGCITANTADFAGGALNSSFFAPTSTKPRLVRLTSYKNEMTPLGRRLLVADHVLSSHCACSCAVRVCGSQAKLAEACSRTCCHQIPDDPIASQEKKGKT